jgi:hypothetical protein
MQFGFRLSILIPFNGEANQWSISGLRRPKMERHLLTASAEAATGERIPSCNSFQPERWICGYNPVR